MDYAFDCYKLVAEQGFRVAKDKADTAALAAGMSFEEGAEALSAAEEWAATDGLDARAVQARLESLITKINDRLDGLKPSNSETWALYKSMLRVRYQLQQSATAVLAEGAAVKF